MRQKCRTRALAPVLVAVCVLAAPALVAEDGERELGWFDKAELGFVATGGNTETETFAFSNTLDRVWESSKFTFKAGGLRAEQTSDAGTYAFGAPGMFDVVELDVTEKTAEAYYANGRYEHDFSARTFWFVGAGWERDRFSGIDDRWTAGGGVGNTWIDDGDVLFKTDYAVTYTDETPTTPDPTVDDSYLGARFSWEYENQLTETTTYENDLVVNLNVDESEDWRASMLNAISVAMTKKLALKVSLLVKYDNLPALETIALYDTVTQDNLLGTVAVPLDETDTLFTASLVVNF